MIERTGCPDLSHLRQWLDGNLPEPECALLDQHLESCENCQQSLDGLVAGEESWNDMARQLGSARTEIDTAYARAKQGPSTGTSGNDAMESDEDVQESLSFLEASARPDSLGRLAHYEILEVIGRGGMGIVLRAFDEKLHRVVAIKVMAPQLAATSPPRKRFLREARSAAQIRHEHVVDIHAVEEQPIPYLVMEYVSGENLQQKLNRIGPLDVPEVLRIGRQIALGLAAAHSRGLIHRDIKPANVLLENGIEQRVKITDFGLARAADDASVTQSGVVAGTPMYMAPEQTHGETIDQRADLFSFGSLLYTMCSGRPPFRASTSLAVLKRVAEDTPRPIREIIPEVPQWLCDLIAKLHAKKPEDRFQSAAEVADLLGQYLEQLKQSSATVLPEPLAPSGKGVECKNSPDTTGVSSLRSREPVEGSRGLLSPRRRRVRAIAAAIMICLFAGLSLAEAVGVTNLRGIVLRVFTPDGTLVVETNDPAVKVTVEGDGGLVIAGAGLEEIRLRPGSYRVQASRGGEPVPLDKNLVEVARGDRTIVRVKLETAAAPSVTVDAAERSAFVVLGREGIEVRKCDTLAEAVLGASADDTIEIRGNGPFLSEPIVIEHRLVIRAGDGFWPVLKLRATELRPDSLIEAHAPLVMEGLDIREASSRRPQPALLGRNILFCSGDSLHLANCRLLQEEPILEDLSLVMAHGRIVVKNCEFHQRGAHYVSFGNGVPVRLLMENCVGLGGVAVFVNLTSNDKESIVEFHGNTLIAHHTAGMDFGVAPDPSLGDDAEKLLRFETSANVFDMQDGVLALDRLPAGVNWQSTTEAESAVTPLLGWSE